MQRQPILRGRAGQIVLGNVGAVIRGIRVRIDHCDPAPESLLA
jgi:hypothetical protein